MMKSACYLVLVANLFHGPTVCIVWQTVRRKTKKLNKQSCSGFKRAFRIKDFGDIIPGHGGITDRFDCQIVMGLFTHMYLYTFVYSSGVTLEYLKRASDVLTDVEKGELVKYLVQTGAGGGL